MNKTIEYFKEVQAEAKNVKWPTRKQTLYFTLAVLVVSLFVAYYLGFWDYLFSEGLSWLLAR
jgi:preprotein translocase SecE subunit